MHKICLEVQVDRGITMADPRDLEMIKPFGGDPFSGNLSTPISDSAFTRAFIGNLPIYRKGLSPILRGLEIGMAHGYFILGPWAKLGPLRDNPEAANLGAFISALALLLIATGCMAAYGIATFQGENASDAPPLETAEGWNELTAGFLVGGASGAFVAYLLLENFTTIDAIFRGLIN